jgi:profilin
VTNTGIVFGSFSTAINAENGGAQNAGECNKRVLDMQKYLKD